MPLLETITRAREAQKHFLLEQRCAEGYWQGRLSSSALATAVAIRALQSVDSQKYAETIEASLVWLKQTQLEDGSWGDTVRSKGNISTTLLCYSVIPDTDDFVTCRLLAETFINQHAGGLDAPAICTCILERYGNDRTFSAPILTLAAISGKLGSHDSCWDLVPQLPFELAALPRQCFHIMKMDVVSYALPALIAIGLVRHVKKATYFLPGRLLRNSLTPSLLKKLEAMQPENGGFLEAVPLTAFVTMSLAEAGYSDSSVVTKGIDFILSSMRGDGSLPIDTNLETWLTSQSIKALRTDDLSGTDREQLREWYHFQQFNEVHPFTGAAPGGWGWASLPGAVPDADDTAGALLALRGLGVTEPSLSDHVRSGLLWLMSLQNSDGGFPTFCRGWGKLPFDQSCPDISGHALEAFSAWYSHADHDFQSKMKAAADAALDYLSRRQTSDGSWLPLWFGNEDHPDDLNPCYGTGMVLDSLNQLHPELTSATTSGLKERAEEWLWNNRNSDGSWGGSLGLKGSREETALAIAALATPQTIHSDKLEESIQWLIENKSMPASPIGLYFASLWYYEDLYPEIFTLRALTAAESVFKKST